ncbi:MAG: glycoside hydrolase family 116 protein, partial [Anaerolineae bacterium]|nr:glycoside hydrolase family 116 protein [Anaerolineae bacterium]
VCDSDLPRVVKEAALFNLSTLRSQTTFQTADGYIYGWEGCDDTAGCCFGSCTHVWNYEQATAFLFGDLARRMREVEFLYTTRDDGGMSFRVNLPLKYATAWSLAAADGQMGCLMKLYRDWQLSGDDEFLRRLWPKARKALEFCWIPGGWDADKDGVMEGCQHNTMDVEYYGPNPQMGIWYLGALRSGEEMARQVGETDFADECRRLYENGRAWIDAHLFNGDYYEHEIRPAASKQSVFGMLLSDMGAADPTDPVLQLGAGCLVDQLVGQFVAHVCGLGYLTNPDHVQQTLRSIKQYNFKQGMFDHFNHMRSYVLNDESALLMATYPRGNRPQRPFPYYNEVMTGFEYSAAIGMLYEGQIDDGL